MKGDFTRNTFNASKHFSRVLMQQGRVQLDADWNEQIAILWYYLQTLAADLTGPHAGPKGNCGFEIIVRADQLPDDEQKRLTELGLWPLKSRDFLIGKGHYYVDGVLCENEDYVLYSWQPDLANELPPDGTHLVYLDIWERHISAIEDPDTREDALGGPDTATRAKLVWQVKVLQTESDELDQLELKQIAEHPIEQQRVLLQLALLALTEKLKSITKKAEKSALQTMIEEFKNKLAALSQVRLRARARLDQPTEDPCITPPEARYRGAENQLYRVEIHRCGSAWDGEESTKATAATFKWSRDNGSVVFPIRKIATDSMTGTTTVTLEHLGRDDRFGLAVGDWVEIVDDDYVLQGRAEPLLQVDAVDPINVQVILEGLPDPSVSQEMDKHPLLRRWDHKEGDLEKGGLELHEGATLVLEGQGDKNWLILEDGVRIQFQEPDKGQEEQPENQYRPGDYWLIPARTATGDVEWPKEKDDQGNPKKDNQGNLIPEAVPPHGVEHHYAPLAIISVSGEPVEVVKDCRYQFELIRTLVS